MDERLVEVEVKLAYQDKLVEELNGVVIEQRKEIDEIRQGMERMRVQMDKLVERLREVEGE